jgi:BatD DUF11 like domain
MVTIPTIEFPAGGRGNPWRESAGWVRSWRLVFVLMLSVFAVSAAPSFSVELEPEQVAAGESAMLKLIFTGFDNPPTPEVPVIPNCTVNRAGVSHQFTSINFKNTSSIIHQFAIEPKSAGTVQIPAITVEADGKRYTSQPMTLRVGPGFDQSQIGFLKVSAPRPEVYVGETFPIEIRFYFRNAPDQQAPPSISMEGFLKGRQQAESLAPETTNGAVHGVARWTLAVTAIKPGEFDIGPAELLTLYRFRDPRRIFGGFEQRKLTFTSEPIQVRVLAPPATGRPAGYEGAVGRFKLEVTASPTNVVAGDPVTVRVRVTGTGNFDGLRLPDLPANSGFQAYPGTNSFVESDPLGLSGTKNFEMVVVPEQPGLQRLRWPVLSFWDPVQRRYVTEQPRPLQIQVRPGTLAQAQPVGSNVVAGPAVVRPAPGVTAGDLALKSDLGAWAPVRDSVVTRAGYWCALGLPLVGYAAVGLGLWWRRRRTQDPAVALRHRARHAVAEAIANLADHARAGRAPQFYSALNAALQGQLSLTLGGNSASYTEDVIDGKLTPLGLGAEDATRLRALFGLLSQARFSPGSVSGDLVARQQDAEASLAALRRLEGVS